VKASREAYRESALLYSFQISWRRWRGEVEA
jgi:hypothetical protein